MLSSVVDGHNVDMILHAPFTTTTQILERCKIHLSHEARSHVPFLSKAKGTVAAIAVPGEFGGIQIFFEALPLPDMRQRIEDLARNEKVKAETASEEWTLLARYLSNAWEVTFSLYKNRYTVVLPRAARGLGLIPSEGEVLLFTYGNIFEIWKPGDWNAVQLKIRERIELLAEDVTDTQSSTSD
jgi:hypothetical protein